MCSRPLPWLTFTEQHDLLREESHAARVASERNLRQHFPQRLGEHIRERTAWQTRARAGVCRAGDEDEASAADKAGEGEDELA